MTSNPWREGFEATASRTVGIAEHAMREATAVIRNAFVKPTQRVVAQTRRRLNGAMPESASRRVSFHDVDARPIRKGRLGRPVEFGYKPRSWTTSTGSSSTTTSR